MDPFSAISLAGNLIQFAEYAARLIAQATAVYRSSTGTTEENADLAVVVGDLSTLTGRLAGKAGDGSTNDERALIDLSTKCCALSDELVKTLSKIQGRKRGSKAESIRVAWRAMKEKDNLSAMEKRIDRYRSQILQRITTMMR